MLSRIAFCIHPHLDKVLRRFLRINLGAVTSKDEITSRTS
jgi:hypothetical protein